MGSVDEPTRKENERALERMVKETAGDLEEYTIKDFEKLLEKPTKKWTLGDMLNVRSNAKYLLCQLRDLLNDRKRVDEATTAMVNRIRQYCADGMGLKPDQLGGMEAAVLSLAVECKTARAAIAKMQAKQEVEKAPKKKPLSQMEKEMRKLEKKERAAMLKRVGSIPSRNQ